ncbi:MAG: hypothetical protein HQ594_04435 [Candidatus Omnitrophica bacterium]|nr:hypothetical protein [Candidatus Omnitrophota bacterium]
MKKLIRIIHSTIWWIDWVVIMVLSLIFDAIIWPGSKVMCRKAELFWAWTLMKLGGIKLDITGQENIP